MLTASQLVHNFLEQNKANFLKLSPKFYDKNGYEKEFARVFGLEQSKDKANARYWDVKLTYDSHEVFIELKKSKSGTYFLDNVRYCEMYLAKKGNTCPQLKYPTEAKQHTVTCFIKTDNKRIDKIYIVDSDELLEVLEIDETRAEEELVRYEEYKRGAFYQNNQIGIRAKHIQLVSKIINCYDIYPNSSKLHLGRRVELVKNNTSILTRQQRPKVLPMTNEKKLNHNLETIMSIVKRIAVDNKFMVRELNDCLPELKKLCPVSYNGQTPKNSLSYNVGRIGEKGSADQMWGWSI